MAESERGWTDEYPHKAGAGDEYYFVRRKDRNDVVVMGFSIGKAWLNGVSYEPSELRSHLFLGPLSPADAEQLSELRKAAGEALTYLEDTGESCRTHDLIAALRAALNPKQPEKETEEK